MHSRSPDPIQHLLDDLDGGASGDSAVDDQVGAVLRTVHDRLTAPPDELLRHRHLADMRRAGRRRRRVGRAGSLGRLSGVTLALGVVLAVTGLLPATLQQTVADAATLVGITLPTPGPIPAGDEVPSDAPQITEIGGVDDVAPPSDPEEPDTDETEPPPGSPDR